jgi:aspartate aminotransferase
MVVIDESCDVYRFNDEFANWHPENINSENVVRIKSFSKKNNISGYRIGYIIANNKIINHIKEEVPAIYGNPTVMAYNSILLDYKILNNEINDKEYELIYKNNKKILKTNLDLVYSALKNCKKVSKVIKPQACYYIFFRINSKIDNLDLFKKIFEDLNIALLPGRVFGERSENWFRLCFARDTVELESALSKLIKFFDTI